MLQSIWDTLVSIGNGIVSIVDALIGAVKFCINFFKDLLWVAESVGDVPSGISSWLGFLPSFVISSVVLLVTVAVIFRILGR